MIAQSRNALTEQELGIIRKAMALRVKYRIHHGKSTWKRILIRCLGIHKWNRCGIYPSPEVVKNLGIQLLLWGYSQEEADHQGVCVQEVPTSESARAEEGGRLKGYEYLSTWNEKHCRCSELLDRCFADSDITYGTLSHSHLLLVLLCWASGGKWDLRDNEGAPRFCDSDGRLDLSAVAEYENATEMLLSIKEGLKMEVLSWKINVEEPTACSMISQALNKGHEAALRTGELTALAVLTGAITRAQESKLAQKLAYESVKEAVRTELDVFADEPEFVEL